MAIYNVDTADEEKGTFPMGFASCGIYIENHFDLLYMITEA